MKTVATLAALAAMANAHATFQQLWKNGKDLESTCARLPSTNSPVEDYTGTALQCNVSPSPAKGKCAFAAGDEVTIEMHQQQNDRSCENQAIGGAHWGPVLAYMSKVEDSSSADGSSEFFKVYENTWAKNPKASQGDEDFWGTKDLNYNCGKLSFKIPEGLAAGDYLLRAEAIALHAASSSGGAQHYMTCYQLTVTGSGTLEPKGVKFPEAYSKTGPGLGFSIHTNMDSYPAPGPKLIAGGTEAKPQLLTFGKIADVPAATGAPAADETPASTAASAVASSTPAASSAVVEAKPSSAAPSAAPVEPTSTAVESETVPTSTPVAEVPFPAGNSTSTMAGTVSSVPVVAPTTMMTSVRPITTAEPSGPIKEYYQCGGMNYKGSSQCAEGLECKQWNPWYSQCVKPGANQPGPSKGPQPPAPKPTAAPAQPAQPAKPVSSYEAEAPKPTAEPSSVIPEAAKPTKPATTPSTPSTPSEGAGEKKYTLETFIAFLEQEAGSASAAKIRRMIEALL